MLGVLISPPKHPQSENPKSSATITRKLGRVGAMVNGFDFIVLQSRHFKWDESSLPIAIGRDDATWKTLATRASKANQSHPLPHYFPHIFLLFLVIHTQLQFTDHSYNSDHSYN
jgi:hypothetical protein